MTTYSRPPGVMGGPCLHCGGSQPEHAGGKTCEEVRLARKTAFGDIVQTVFVESGERRDRIYIGDGVYAEHDDFQIWLSTTRENGITHEIALGALELDAIERYRKEVFV